MIEMIKYQSNNTIISVENQLLVCKHGSIPKQHGTQPNCRSYFHSIGRQNFDQFREDQYNLVKILEGSKVVVETLHEKGSQMGQR